MPTSPVLTPFLQAQKSQADNQGKPGFDVLGNAIPTFDPNQVTANQVAAKKLGVDIPGVGGGTPTTISGDKSQTISDNNQKTNDINSGLNQNKAAVFAGGLEKYNDGSPISAPTDAVRQTDENGNSWWTAGGKNYAVGPDTGLSPEQQEHKSVLDKLQAQSDSAFAGQIAAVRQQYDALIKQQALVNKGREAGTSQALLEGGSSRYAPVSSENIQANEVSRGISDIADLTSKEISAIASLNSAQMSHDYELANKKLEEVDKIRADKQKTMDELQKNIQTGIKDAKDKVQKSNDAADTAIRQVMLDAGKSGSLSDDQEKKLQEALTNHDYAAALSAAGDSLQTATGQLGDYLQYKKDAKANGLVPTDYATWKKADDADQSKLKSSEAYNTAYSTAKGKAAGEADGDGSKGMNIPVISYTGKTKGLSYDVPADLAPYAKFSANGTKYVDLSSLTKAEAQKMGQKAILNGYKPIFDGTIAGDLINITDASDKISSIRDAFSSINPADATQRNLYEAAFIKLGKELQTNPDAAASGVYEIAALDIIKAASGTKGGRISVKTIEDLEKNFPKNTDTKATVNKKLDNMMKTITDRERAIIGEPSASDKLLIEHKDNEDNITKAMNSLKTTNPKLYDAASGMYTSLNPETGQPYSPADILQVFPELNTK